MPRRAGFVPGEITKDTSKKDRRLNLDQLLH